MSEGGGTYFTEETFVDEHGVELDYREVREEALKHTEKLGDELLENSVTATAYAADSGGEGQSVGEFLAERAENEIEHIAARFIGYEVTESIRRNTLKQANSSGNMILGSLVNADSLEEGLQRAFFLVDRKKGGYIDLRPSDLEDDPEPKRHPTKFSKKTTDDDYLMPLHESDNADPEDLGWLNLSGIYVMNDDWIMYRNGEEPLGVEKEYREDVYEFLDSLDVGR